MVNEPFVNVATLSVDVDDANNFNELKVPACSEAEPSDKVVLCMYDNLVNDPFVNVATLSESVEDNMRRALVKDPLDKEATSSDKRERRVKLPRVKDAIPSVKVEAKMYLADVMDPPEIDKTPSVSSVETTMLSYDTDDA